MAACKVADQLHRRSSLPPGFEDLLNDLARSVITTQPLDLLDHIADYLEALVDRRTLWDMQLQSGAGRQKSYIVKCEKDEMGTRETQPCPTPPKRLNNATRKLPSPKPQNEDCNSAEVQAKPRPATALGKPIRSNAKPTSDVWADETVLASHLAQHEALRQVIKEIENANEQIIALEQTVRSAAQCTKKTRNTTQTKDLDDKHSKFKRALDKMMLICTWIKSNDLSDCRSPEAHENVAGRDRNIHDVNQTFQGTLENQIDTLKGTMQHMQAALASKRKMEQISPETSGCQENAKILDDMAKLNQWLQYMVQMLSRSGAQSQVAQSALLGSQTASSQNAVMLTDTTEAKKADKSSLRKQMRLNVETASVPEKQTKAPTAKHHQPTPAYLTNELQNEADRKMETRINLQYYANETDKKKDTRVILVSTTSRESHTPREAAQTKRKPISLAGSQTSTTSGMILDGAPDTKNYQMPEAEIANTDPRRGSVPVPLRKPLKAAPINLNASETELAKLQITRKADSLDKKDHKEIATEDRPKSQTTNNDSNISNIDSHSASTKLNLPLSHDSIATSSYVNMFYTQSVSSVSENSWYPKQSTAAKPKEKRCPRKHGIPNEVCESPQPNVNTNVTQAVTGPLEFDNTIAQIPASSGSSLLSIHARTDTNIVREITRSPSSEKIPHQPTKEHVLSNEIVSTSFIKSSSYATANLSVQEAGTSRLPIEKPDTTEPNASSRSLAQSSSHSAAKSSSQKGKTTKPVVETADNLQPNAYSSESFVKLSSHSTAKSSSPKGDPKKPTPGTTPENLQPNVFSSTSFAKLSSHSTAKQDSRKGEAASPSKEVIPAAPQPNGATSTSFTKTSSHSTAKSDSKKGEAASPSKEVIPATPHPNGATSTSFTKTSSHSTAKTPSYKEVPPITVQSSNHSTATLKSHKADMTTVTKEANPEQVQPNDASSPSFTKPSSHSVTKSGTQKAISLSAEPLSDKSNTQTMNDQTSTPRFVEYKNIFPQISSMQITPESSHSTMSKKPPTSPSAKSLNNAPEASHKDGNPSDGASSIERVKTQKAVVNQQQRTENAPKTENTKLGVALAQAQDPVENAFGKLSIMSGIVIPKGSTEGMKQADSKSIDNIKLEKTSINSASKSSTSSAKNVLTEIPNPESGMENNVNGKQIQRSGTEINKPQLTAEGNNNNMASTQQDNENASELSLYSFKMSQQTVKENTKSGKN